MSEPAWRGRTVHHLVAAALIFVSACGEPPGTADESHLDPPAIGVEGATPGTDPFPTEVVDQADRVVRFEEPPLRIVSLVPSATEILVALGQTYRLVGRTDHDRTGELAHLPSVGGGLEPSLERLVALEPDLVIRFHGPSDPVTPSSLDARGVPHLAVRPDRIDDVRRLVSSLGRVVGVPERADSLLTRMDRELDAVARDVEGLPQPTVAFLLGGNPPLVAGAGTFVHELLELAGGTNILADAGELYAPVSVEEIILREPDLLLVSEGGSIPPALGGIPSRTVSSEVEIPGVHMSHSAAELARALHPERAP